MRITFPFEALTKIGFVRICFFNLFSENLNLPRHSFLRRLWEIWHWQYIFVTFLSLLFQPPIMKIPLCTMKNKCLISNNRNNDNLFIFIQRISRVIICVWRDGFGHEFNFVTEAVDSILHIYYINWINIFLKTLVFSQFHLPNQTYDVYVKIYESAQLTMFFKPKNNIGVKP
jgi:hypothetical protein